MNIATPKNTLVIGLSLLVALFVYVNYINQSNRQPTDLIRIGISQTPLSSPFLIASNNHNFTKLGLNIELVPCFGGVACAEMLFSGQVDYATASESVVMFQSFKRNDFKVLASFVGSSNDLKLLALQNKNINKIEDLSGKRVGLIKSSSSEFYLDSLLIASNLKKMELDKVYLSPQELGIALISNQVDAISVWEPYGYLVEANAENRLTNLGIAGIYTLSFNLIALDKTINADHKSAALILEAVGSSIEWIHKNPTLSRAFIAQELNIPIEQLEWSWSDYVFRLSLGNALLSNLQQQARWALDSGIVSGMQPDYRSVMFTEPLEKVFEQEAF